MNIHPTAIVDDQARLHPSVTVGPYSIIETGVIIGEGCTIESSVHIFEGTSLGRCNRVYHGVVLGCEPQDITFDATKSKPLTIGDYNQFREGTNISRGVNEEHGTVIGSHNYFMTFAHVGHDCLVGDHNIFVTSAIIAGHVTVEHHVFLSGHSATHQFCRIGAYSLVSGVSGVTQDVPPYVMADGHRAEVVGLNTVGLRRNGFKQPQRNMIKSAYRLIYRSGLKQAEALARLRADSPSAEVNQIVSFIEKSKRGIISYR